jgi:hypothetical protein
MGLDDDPSWIVTTEINRFFWPGHDLRRVKEEWQPGGPAWHWGFLPVNIFNQAKEAVLKHRAEKTLAISEQSRSSLVKGVVFTQISNSSRFLPSR